ncbi:MAG: hypothetical protein QNJ53_12345 [Pleurocapsa sp. MO_192.B19]|nr:hypothetical protein [Pleurocapsa sp. MO_192.B19]
MTKLHNDNHQNLVSFLRHHQPNPPHAQPDLEQRIMDSLEPRATTRGEKRYGKSTWTSSAMTLRTPAKLIATGFLFTSVSFGIRTPRIAVEPKDLENFLVNNWNDTLDNYHYAPLKEAEAYWLVPNVYEPQQALSVSTK